MKIRSLVGGILLAGSLIGQNAAHAAPYSFQFTEAYDYATNASIFGTAATITVTLDNGAASSVSQAYTWNDIVGVSVQAVGGTFSDVWTNIYRSTDTTLFLTTDATGLSGTVSFGTSGSNHYVNGSSTFTSGAYNQLGSGYYTTLALTFNAADHASLSRDITTTATLTSGTVQPVPEPETYAMLMAGLGLLGAVARRRKPQA